MRNKGFTLVELSIVLVIIGLLISGILIGQSLIESAQVNAQVKQIQQYDIAAAQFQSKFKQIPGDSNRVSPTGNNNRIIENNNVSGWGPVMNCCSSETWKVWPQLANSGILSETFSSYSYGTDLLADVHVPAAKVGYKNTIILALTNNSSTNWGMKDSKIWWTLCLGNSPFIGNANSACRRLNATGQGPIKPIVAAAIDQKIDDGQPGLGDVQSTRALGANADRDNGNSTTGYCSYAPGNSHAASYYRLSGSNANTEGCDMYFKMGIQQ